MDTLIDNPQVVVSPQGVSTRREQLQQPEVVWRDGGQWSTSRIRHLRLSGACIESTEALPEQELLPLCFDVSTANSPSQVEKPANRRLHRRVQTPGSPYISHPDGNARIKELSVTGAYVMDIRPLSAGDEFRFSLPAGRENIRLEGVVVRSDPRRGMAIRFRNVSSDTERSLRRYIARLNSPLAEGAQG